MNIKSKSTSTDKQDEVFFEQYLQGKSTLSDIYQNTDCPKPSNELDQSILNAAKTSIENSKLSNVMRPNHWYQPLSWAASIAIFSLVGLLTLNTWESEQDNLEQELLQPQAISEERSVFSPVSSGISNFDSNSHLKKRNKPLSQSKEMIPQEVKNDSRKLLYKNEAIPEMQAAPAYMGRNQIGTLPKRKSLNSDGALASTPAAIADEIIETKQSTLIPQKQDVTHSTDQEIWLNRVRLLINKNKIDEAHELIAQFRIKYPDYPIDPIILQNLAPY